MRSWWTTLLLIGCAQDGPPDLLSQLTGTWSGTILEASLRRSEVVMGFGPTGEGHFGFVWVDEVDGIRRYGLTDAVSVEELGVALDFQEQGGVRRLVISILVPFEPMEQAGWNASWYCAEEPDQECEQIAALRLERL
ncbi:MAG: hypothetical protein KC621_00280 [Myxococcales bacterium]|nr:hypothetical protein [Myxococcales bacterium]